MSAEEISMKKKVTNVDFSDRKLFESLEHGGLVDQELLL